MSNEYVLKFGRWIKKVQLISAQGSLFAVSLTLKDSNGTPSSVGKNTIDWFCSQFEPQWNFVLDKLIENNNGYEKESIEQSISEKIYLTAPALVGCDEYDLLLILDLELICGQKKTYSIVYNSKKILSIEEIERSPDLENDEEEWSIKVARIIEKAVSKSFKLDLYELNTTLDAAEKECLSLLNSESEKLEVNRRILEWKVKLYCDKNLPLETVNDVYQKLIKRGYSNIDVESNTETYYAKYLLRAGETQIARKILKSLVEKLESLSSTVDSGWCDKMTDYSKSLLAQCES